MHDTVYHNNERLHSLNTLNRWVSYSGKPVKEGKIDKAPINPKTGHLASNNRPATWGSKAQAERHARTLKSPGSKPGVGIVLGPLDERIALCGVDLDGCVVDGTLEPWAEEIRAKLASYTEISPSGEGAKIFFLVATSDLPALRPTLGAEHRQQWKKGASHYGIELHLSNSYFTVTGQEYGAVPIVNRYVGADDLLRLVPLSDLKSVIARAKAFSGTEDREHDKGSPNSSHRIDVVYEALMAIPNDGSIPENHSRDWWLEVGMALHHEYGDTPEGFVFFDAWSQEWPGYDSDATEKGVAFLSPQRRPGANDTAYFQACRRAWLARP